MNGSSGSSSAAALASASASAEARPGRGCRAALSAAAVPRARVSTRKGSTYGRRCHVGAAVTEQKGEALSAAGLHGAPSRQWPNCCAGAQEQPAHADPSRPLHARAHAIQRGGPRRGGGAPAPAAVPREDVEYLALLHHLHPGTRRLSGEAREGNAGRIDARATHRGHVRGGHAEAIVRAAQYTVALDSRKCVLCELDTITHLEAGRSCTPRMQARSQLQRSGRKAESRWQVKRQQHGPVDTRCTLQKRTRALGARGGGTQELSEAGMFKLPNKANTSVLSTRTP
eukprot:scaffold79085_cov66-Phaeocystis_antarctica.AAC.2